MRLIRWLLSAAIFVFLLSLFGENLDVRFQIKYWWIQPIQVTFWQVVVFSVAFGIIIAAVSDFIADLKWLREKRRMIRRDREHDAEVQSLNDRIASLESDNQRIKAELEDKSKELRLSKTRETTPPAEQPAESITAQAPVEG